MQSKVMKYIFGKSMETTEMHKTVHLVSGINPGYVVLAPVSGCHLQSAKGGAHTVKSSQSHGNDYAEAPESSEPSCCSVCRRRYVTVAILGWYAESYSVRWLLGDALYPMTVQRRVWSRGYTRDLTLLHLRLWQGWSHGGAVL